MIQKLISLPPNLVDSFHELRHASRSEWYVDADPVDRKLGSGGGTSYLLSQAHRASTADISFDEWLGRNKRIIIHAGGQSRRLPAYAPSGKVLAPIPVFRWERGQRLGQMLIDLQVPFYEDLLEQAPENIHTLVASGDVYVRTGECLPSIPDADVVCLGLWTDAAQATRHGVFAAKRTKPGKLDFMLQKPDAEELQRLSDSHQFMIDVGVWLLSDRAVKVLNGKSKSASDGFYDLYGEFGCALGENPKLVCEEVKSLHVAVVPLPQGEFYHFGTSRELIDSMVALQNRVADKRRIMGAKVKPHPAIFTQNAFIETTFTGAHAFTWIENCHIGKRWKLNGEQIITGIPVNDWQIELPRGVCLDLVPVGENGYAVRPYGMDDGSRGAIGKEKTLWMGVPVREWFGRRNIPLAADPGTDIQSAPLFPVITEEEVIPDVIRWMTAEPENQAGREAWQKAEKLSADILAQRANLRRLFRSRETFTEKNWKTIERNYKQSVFYQLDLSDVASEYKRLRLDVPEVLPPETSRMMRIHNRMLRSHILDCKNEEEQAFKLLSEGITEAMNIRNHPMLSVLSDQIIWGRSPVRIDLAGGWTDTPPYALYAGGYVVNIAVELNGQPPLQVYIKPSERKHIVLRSIDLGATETVTDFETLKDFNRVGSPFSIPKAALSLAGFAPEFCSVRYRSLEEQLDAFGCGLEVTLLSAVPAGSGLGTSSILALTVLGAINEFCGLQLNKPDLAKYTLVLEQLLTTGGGWQDQYGGLYRGIKLLKSEPGFLQTPEVNWLPDPVFEQPEYKACHLLYYTGITRTAKGILADIVRNMFLNEGHAMRLLERMKHHALHMAGALQRADIEEYGRLLRHTWTQNCALDAGTNPPAIQAIIRKIDDELAGYKLPGAGGGGYIYMLAKDPESAARVRRHLIANPPNGRARFVEMRLSGEGLKISRS